MVAHFYGSVGSVNAAMKLKDFDSDCSCRPVWSIFMTAGRWFWYWKQRARMDAPRYRWERGGRDCHDSSVTTDHFTWHPVSRAVGNVKNQGSDMLIA
jgi:hypothetical protein